jgi:type I restriction enzyme S subunit
MKQPSRAKKSELDMIPEEREEIVFSEAVLVNPKRDLKKGTRTKFVSMVELSDFKKRIQGYTFREYSGGSKFINGDTLMARITPCLENGKTALVNILDNGEVGGGSTEFIVLSAKEGKTIPQFVYYLAISPEVRGKAIKSMTGTSGRQRVENDVFDKIVIKLPSISEQYSITNVLGDFDLKIELNQQMNATLEKIGQAFFKHWFIDFDFPNERGKPYKSSSGKMVDSELGEIPKGWTAGKFCDLVEVTTGKGLKRDEFVVDGNFSVLGANGELGKTDKYLFDEKLILTGRVGTLGTVYLIKDKCWISDNVLISKPIQEENYYYAFFVIRQFDFQSLNRGSTQPLITQTDLKNQRVVIPNKETLVMFHKILAGLYEKLDLNNYESKYLSQIRDSLLPKLMSGKIRVNAHRSGGCC